MKSSTITNITCISISAVALAVIVALLIARSVKKSTPKVSALVKLLQSAGWKLLGTEQCMWTQQQKSLVGNGIEKIYVNCATSQHLCSNIEGVPTWLNERDGKRCLGFQSEQDLRNMVTTGACPKRPEMPEPETPAPTSEKSVPSPSTQLSETAKKAYDKGLRCLGTKQCGWTNKQLELVDEMFFVDCTNSSNTKKCGGVSGFPTWCLCDGDSCTTVAVGFKSAEDMEKVYESVISDTNPTKQPADEADAEPVTFEQETGSESPNFEQTFYKPLAAK